MTIREVIERVDALRENRMEQSLKLCRISELEAHIYEDIVLRHEGAQAYMHANGDGSFSHRSLPYQSDTQELIAPARFSKMYEAYLRCEIDLAENETALYANDVMLFEHAFEQFAAWYNETHLPLQSACVKVKPSYMRG